MRGPFYDGELWVQERAGVREMARRVGRSIHEEIPDGADEYLAERRFLVLGFADAGGDVWASAVAGPPGFLSAPDGSMRVAALPDPDDPLAAALAPGLEVGTIAIDFATRRRMRLNGTVSSVDERGFAVAPSQVFGNCPKYITRRSPETADYDARPGAPREADRLDGALAAVVSRADAFFVATRADGAGADASHRGGRPGFVRVLDERTIAWPDYEGNTMFLTLGNVRSDGRAGLLFLDFETGDALQLSGTARLVWSEDGASRATELAISRVRFAPAAFPVRSRFLELSPFDPA